MGTQFLFKLAVPVLDNPFALRGQVAWVNTEKSKQNPDVEECGMGIRFLYEDDGQRKKFEELAEKLMANSLGDVVFRRLLDRS